MEDIEKCKKHGMDIVSFRGNESHCDECHVELIKELIAGHDTDTIARWVYKNSLLNNDAWPSNRNSQMYSLEMLQDVNSFSAEYFKPIMNIAIQRMYVIEWEMQGESEEEIRHLFKEKFGEELNFGYYFDELGERYE